MGTPTTRRREPAAASRGPTVLPPAAGRPDPSDAAGRAGAAQPLPGVVHLPSWLDLGAQQALVSAFREWATPPAGLRHPRVPTGHLMSVQSVCLGWHWQPYVYSRTADDTDGAPVKPLPADVVELGRRAVTDTMGGCPGGSEPAGGTNGAAIVNLYAPGARLGLHQDGEEPSGAPS